MELCKSLAKRVLSLLQSNFGEGYGVAGAKLAEIIQIGRDDLGDLRVTTNSLAVHSENDALPVIGDLHTARAYRLGNDFLIRTNQRRAQKSNSHAIAGRCNCEMASTKG